MKQKSLFSLRLLDELEKGTIRCGSCKIEKPAEEFGANKSKKNGKNEYCRACSSERDKKHWRSMSPEARAKKKARKRAYDATEKGKAAKRARAMRWRAEHPGWSLHLQYMREQGLKRNFNLTQEEYDVMLASQGGVCAICKQPDSRKKKDGTPFSLSVDHNHATGEIRGLLCARCNTSLACFEDEDFFNAALAYLERFASTQTTEAGLAARDRVSGNAQA